MSKYIGIDLGTSSSALAWLREDGNPEIVPNADGERLTPSVVFFEPYEDIKLVGTSARDAGDPNRTVYYFKRHMDNPDWVFQIGDQKWTATEIGAMILAKLKRDCSKIIGPITDAVITVPANFNELARRSTVAAANIAGINVTRLVNEPTAAALYYAHSHKISGRVMIYDLGAGTLDISIMEISGDNYRILTSEGARHLGGSNFDEILLEVYASTFRSELGTELYTNERERRQMLQAVEDTKKILSKLSRHESALGNERIGLTPVSLTRDVFEQAISRLLGRTNFLVEQAMLNAGLTAKDIDHVVLVGGSTRIPVVKKMLKKQLGKEPIMAGNVDECVALGAALFARKAANVSEICNHSYGTIALVTDPVTGKDVVRNSIVISKNSEIPCSCTQIYATSEDDERLIEVEITQGEDTDPRYVDVVGKIVLEVPPNRPAGCRVSVTYSYDESQRVHVTVKDEESGRVKEVAVSYQGAGVLSEEDIKRKTAYLKQIRIE